MSRKKKREHLYRTEHALNHLANREGVVIGWTETIGLSALLRQIRLRRVAAKKSRMLSSQQRADRRRQNRSAGLV